MPSLLVLISLVALCVASLSSFEFDSSSAVRVPDHDAQFQSDTTTRSHRDHEDSHRDRAQRRHDKAVVNREERHEDKKESNRSDDDDDDLSFSGVNFHKRHHLGRLQNRIDRHIEDRIQEALSDATVTLTQSKPYQLRCGRNATLGADSVNDTAAARVVGPLLLIGKTSLTDVTSDSFDGNNDGRLDVLEARDFWENGVQTAANQAVLIDKFVLAIRNRATVNGGSIDLRSIVRTGRHVVTKKHKSTPGNFFTFSATTVLITPCFPLTTEPNYNVDVYASGLRSNVFNHTLLYANIPATDVYTVTNGVATFNDGGNTIDLIRRTGSAAGTVEGHCLLQVCTQHAYFQ